MQIGELAKRTGVTARLLRYYEEQGLLRPRRSSNGYREYGVDDIDSVRGIRQLLEAGLSTATIAELLPCMIDRGDGLAPLCPELLPDLEHERARLNHAIATLESARLALERIIGGSPDRVTHSLELSRL
jgi:DNA-binding transcriptional MerR regulator